MRPVLLSRSFSWVMVSLTFAMLLNNYLTFWLDWPGTGNILSVVGIEAGNERSVLLTVLQLAIYLLALGLPVAWVLRSRERGLRQDAAVLTGVVTYIIRAAFWAVFFIGVADVVISLLRIENSLAPLVGEQLATDLGQAQFRAPFVHLPLMLLAMVVAGFSRTLGFQWLGLLVVVSELMIVFSRFVFSYEQAFMADLVRFWYAALFLFASAYTLLEDGHVRVDVLYSRFSRRKKGRVNVIGTLLLGLVFCWVILILGTATKSSIINGPLITLEVTQSGFGLYVKYMMAGFLGLFAVTMMIQFSAYLLESVADARGEEGSRIPDEEHLPPLDGVNGTEAG